MGTLNLAGPDLSSSPNTSSTPLNSWSYVEEPSQYVCPLFVMVLVLIDGLIHAMARSFLCHHHHNKRASGYKYEILNVP